MADGTKIEWTGERGKSFSPWYGCAHVGAGCLNCYAEAMQGRLGVTWGHRGTRRRAADSTWQNVAAWNRAAAKRPDQAAPIVFASLCDLFEDRDDVAPWRAEWFDLVDRCRSLVFVVATKRPENVWANWKAVSGELWPGKSAGYRGNVWLLVSVWDQGSAEIYVPELHKSRPLVPVLGISAEPLIGRISLATICRAYSLDWIIAGGESGRNARECRLEWLRKLVADGAAARVPTFVKQVGTRPVEEETVLAKELGVGFKGMPWAGKYSPWPATHPKGGDTADWPESLRVRLYPHCYVGG
jgi:protein gp37